MLKPSSRHISDQSTSIDMNRRPIRERRQGIRENKNTAHYEITDVPSITGVGGQDNFRPGQQEEKVEDMDSSRVGALAQ